MKNVSVRNNPLAAFVLIASVFALILGLVVVAGASEPEDAAVGIVEVVNDPAAIVEATTTDLEPVLVSVDAPIETPAASDDAPAEGATSDSAASDDVAPADEHDCEAFFAELDEQYYADQERFAEVLERFDVPFERMVAGDDVWLELDFDDPIVEAITTSFWNDVSEAEGDDVYDHPCFDDVGCGDAEDHEMSEEEKAELRAEWTIENEALVAAFTEAGIEFGWETDEYFEIDLLTWDYEDEAATEVYLEVFNELHPEFAEFEDDGDSFDADMVDSDEDLDAIYAAEMAALDQQLQERAAELEAFAVALDDAGVDHEITNEYDWTIVTFDLDDDRAIAVVAAARS